MKMNNFVDKLENGGNVNDLYEKILDEMIADTQYLMINQHQDYYEFTMLVTEFTSKYCIVVYLLEKEEAYERCAEMVRLIKAVLSDVSFLDKEDIKNSIEMSITIYKNTLDDDNQ